MTGALTSLKEQLLEHGEDEGGFLHLASRAGELTDILLQVLVERSGDWLNWYERKKKSLILHASPLDISSRMQEMLYAKAKSVIMTSATLSAGGSFDYIRSRLGLPSHALEDSFPSHFDFASQAVMYIPKDLPPPGSPKFAPGVADRIAGILGVTGGRALVLFTSHQNLNFVHQRLEDDLPYTLLRQGDAPRSILLESFRDDVHSVLLATGSFWQGIDVPGETLTCLIVDKLPFDSPSEPLVAARINALREQGRNAFLEYQLPSAVISLKQGLGRLLRKSNDFGVLCILDTRILGKSYGRFFFQSLPEMHVCHELSHIEEFLKLKEEPSS